MGKIIKNIILVLIAFLIISGIIAAFTDNSNVKVVPLSDITALINDNKVESIEVDQDTLSAKVKDSDTRLQSALGRNTEIPQFFRDSGVDQAKISALKISYKNNSTAATIAGAVLPFLIPFVLIALFIYFLMRQVQGTNNRALTFGQSSVRLSDERKNKVRFADVA
jgi:cell division protease FtsH